MLTLHIDLPVIITITPPEWHLPCSQCCGMAYQIHVYIFAVVSVVAWFIIIPRSNIFPVVSDVAWFIISPRSNIFPVVSAVVWLIIYMCTSSQQSVLWHGLLLVPGVTSSLQSVLWHGLLLVPGVTSSQQSVLWHGLLDTCVHLPCSQCCGMVYQIYVYIFPVVSAVARFIRYMCTCSLQSVLWHGLLLFLVVTSSQQSVLWHGLLLVPGVASSLQSVLWHGLLYTCVHLPSSQCCGKVYQIHVHIFPVVSAVVWFIISPRSNSFPVVSDVAWFIRYMCTSSLQSVMWHGLLDTCIHLPSSLFAYNYCI